MNKKALMALALALAGAWSHAGEIVYVGTQASQIRALRFDPADGSLVPIGVAAEGGAPTWAIAHPRLPVLYVVNDDKQKQGSVTAYAINRATGALASTGQAPAGGIGTTFLSLDAAAGTLFAANFGSGSASTISLNADGSLGVLASTIQAAGSGPHRRQASAHAHSVTLDPSGRYALVPDLGADRVFVYGFDNITHALTPDDPATPRSIAVSPGSGPRHAVFAGKFLYLMNELTAEIMTLRWDDQQGRLTPLRSLPLSSPDFQGMKSGSAIAASPDGRFIYAANRGEHLLQVYRANAETGELTLVQRIASGGEIPWGFAVHPSGKWLVVANQRSGKLAVFSIDTETGVLANTGQSIDAPSPVSITFAK